jgi:peptidoglycan hydrolase CwlO-like protein
MTTKRKAYVVSAAMYEQAIVESVRLTKIIEGQEAAHRALQSEVRGLTSQLEAAHANVKHMQKQRTVDNDMIISMNREITELQQVIREQRARYDAATHMIAIISGKAPV